MPKGTKCVVFVPLPEVLPGDTETRLFLVRVDCWGVGEWRVLGGGVAGDDGRCLRRGGLAEGDNLRVFRGGLDVLLGGFFGGDRDRDEEDDELLPDSDAEERLLRLPGDLLLLCLGGGGIRLGGVLLRGDGRLLGLGRLLGEYDLDRDLWRRLGLVCEGDRDRVRDRDLERDRDLGRVFSFSFLEFFSGDGSLGSGTGSGLGAFRMSLVDVASCTEESFILTDGSGSSGDFSFFSGAGEGLRLLVL